MPDRLGEIFNVAGKHVVLTGATGYLGRHVARALLDVGASLTLLGRSAYLTGQLSKYQQAFGPERVSGHRVDFYDRDDLRRTLETIARQQPVDVLINNAYDLSPTTGFNTPAGLLESAPYEQWHAAFEAGIYWAVLTTQIIGGKLRQQGRGSIINVSSMYGVVAPSPRLYEGTEFLNPPTYAVSKAGIIGLTRYTASFWGHHGVRCNAVLPGAFPNVESGSANAVSAGDEFLERLNARTALGRVGHPNDLAGVMIYLASDASSYMTGQTLVVDGGWTIT